ncbi:MAG: lactate racemase, partial [Blastocatellia bacterium]|nr:lactate racemase [Blastocatellia bacterium]
MPTIELGYGHSSINFDYDAERFAVLTAGEGPSRPLADAEIGAAFEAPVGSLPLDELIEAGDTVLIVVSDATRATGSAQIVNLLVRRLIQNGIEPGAMAIIFATGIHRPVRPEEKAELLTPFIAQRLRTVDHDADDASQLIAIGEIDGTPVKVNRALREFSKIILTGA